LLLTLATLLTMNQHDARRSKSMTVCQVRP